MPQYPDLQNLAYIGDAIRLIHDAERADTPARRLNCLTYAFGLVITRAMPHISQDKERTMVTDFAVGKGLDAIRALSPLVASAAEKYARAVQKDPHILAAFSFTDLLEQFGPTEK